MNKHFLNYITQNGQLRSIELKEDTPGGGIYTYTATIDEKYLVTGLYINELQIDSYSTIELVKGGLTATEVFLFRATNKLFFVNPNEYRTENIPFVFTVFPKAV